MARQKSSNLSSNSSATIGFEAKLLLAADKLCSNGRVYEVGEVEDDGETFSVKMPRFLAELEAQFAESAKLESEIRHSLAQFDLHP